MIINLPIFTVFLIIFLFTISPVLGVLGSIGAVLLVLGIYLVEEDAPEVIKEEPVQTYSYSPEEIKKDASAAIEALKIADLKKQGLLTEEEFQKQRSNLLASRRRR